mmetsp:Transcript_25553/g.101862  ORF Transcript_25553/g.101862 Transcript_25553/m.101862 type:complete len:300 (+) Transcript_25553:178-1077(+)
MAFERILATLPKTDVPAEAVCYICLDRVGPDSSALPLRGCACRGPSAGFVHVDCSAEMAAREECMPVDGCEMNRWLYCTTCRHRFEGALHVGMHRCRWRRARDAPASDDTRYALLSVASVLKINDEHDVADRLEAASLGGLARDNPDMLIAELMRIANAAATNPDVELKNLTRLRSRVERSESDSARSLYLTAQWRLLAALNRREEALRAVAESFRACAALFGPDGTPTVGEMEGHALCLVNVGRVDEGIAMLNRVLATLTRVFGADHALTRETKRKLDVWCRTLGGAPPQGLTIPSLH